MIMKKAERKAAYDTILRLILAGKDHEAYDALCAMQADDVNVHMIANYDRCRAGSTPV